MRDTFKMKKSLVYNVVIVEPGESKPWFLCSCGKLFIGKKSLENLNKFKVMLFTSFPTRHKFIKKINLVGCFWAKQK